MRIACWFIFTIIINDSCHYIPEGKLRLFTWFFRASRVQYPYFLQIVPAPEFSFRGF